MTTTRGENRLISLIKTGKPARQALISQAVKEDFELIKEARTKGFSWKEMKKCKEK